MASVDSTLRLEQLQKLLESPASAHSLLRPWRLRDPERGFRNLEHLSRHLSLEALRGLCLGLDRHLPRCADPDMALNNLEHFLANPQAVGQLPALLDRGGRGLETLLQLFSTSHFFSDLLSVNCDFLEMLRVPLRRSPTAAELQAQLQVDLDGAADDESIVRALRRFRQRHYLRIGTNDIMRERPLEEITRDLSRVADTCIEAALRVALRSVGKRFGQPVTADGRAGGCAILAFGKLGGEELNYSSDIDLMLLYDEEGPARGGAGNIASDEYYARVASEVIRLLSARTDRGQAYRVDFRLRPEGQRGALATSLQAALGYYDTLGRTWERQALIKVRPVAGDLELGERFLQVIETFVYRKYLTFAEINEIKSMKRRIEQVASRSGVSLTEVKTGRGGIRDIEFTIQFLQLLNGGDLVELRQRNTLLAMEALERVGCLTDQEYRVLDDAYRFLRRTEHRLQLLFDLQTHQLPEADEELNKLGRRMGYPAVRPVGSRAGSSKKRGAKHRAPRSIEPGQAFLADYREKTEPTRRILEHLLHQTFAGEAGQAEPESDLILDSDPDRQTIENVLGKYPFRDVRAAYQNLAQLAQEEVPFLSTRRCRHFLASIAPSLLRALADTPDPDMALVNLEKVTRSLGAKTILWELFSFNPPSLKLYVDLCAWSQFLSEILINNPGMIDELLDSLVLNQPRTADDLRGELTELCRGADDPEPILHSFQDKELLRIGVRDILGKDTIRETSAALSDLAETILSQVANEQMAALVQRHGEPTVTEGPRADRPCRFVLVALGKLGGREMGYHSDLDLMLLYEGEGRTMATGPPERRTVVESVDHLSFFSELVRRIIRGTSHHGPMGRLYEVDMRLRPMGKSGSLALDLATFRDYFDPAEVGEHSRERAQLWERQILTRARVVFGNVEFGEEVMAAVVEAIQPAQGVPAIIDEILAMRERLESSRDRGDLKRGPGGMMDVEFLVETFQLKYGHERPGLRQSNVWQALGMARDAGLLTEQEQELLQSGYEFLLRVRGRLRIVHNRALDEVPDAPGEVDKLARRLGFDSGARLLANLEGYRRQVRELFHQVLKRERMGWA